MRWSARGRTKNGLVGFELEGKKFGVVGLVPSAAGWPPSQNAFGVRYTATTAPQDTAGGQAGGSGYPAVRVATSVSLHVPATEETKD